MENDTNTGLSQAASPVKRRFNMNIREIDNGFMLSGYYPMGTQQTEIYCVDLDELKEVIKKILDDEKE